MLFVDRRRRRAVEVPILLLCFLGFLVFGAVRALSPPVQIGPVIGVGIGLVLFVGLALDSFRVVSLRGSQLVVWRPLGRTSLDARACAFGVRVHYGGRSVSYVTYVTDARERVDVSDHDSVRSADAAVARLEAVFVEGASRRRERAQAAVRRERADWERAQREAQARVEAYYQSPAWRWTKWLVVGGVVVYALVSIVAYVITRR